MNKSPMEILQIDFSKYNSIAINGVLLKNVKIQVEENDMQVELAGKVDDKTIMRTGFLKYYRVDIDEISEGLLSIREVRPC